jgi:aryl-alcohol dehydrogenase-like predicted oxidoreductase
MAIMTRALGRTGADVTILGYGAMELRGRPRGPEIADEDAGRLLNAVLDGGINPHDYAPENVRANVERSLRRLRTDRLDLVQVHMSPSQAALEENRTVETLEDLKAEGKLRFTGRSGILPHLAGNLAIAEKGPLPADLYSEARKRLPLPG